MLLEPNTLLSYDTPQVMSMAAHPFCGLYVAQIRSKVHEKKSWGDDLQVLIYGDFEPPRVHALMGGSWGYTKEKK